MGRYKVVADIGSKIEIFCPLCDKRVVASCGEFTMCSCGNYLFWKAHNKYFSKDFDPELRKELERMLTSYWTKEDPTSQRESRGASLRFAPGETK